MKNKEVENVATAALLEEARKLSKDLGNGQAANLEKQGNAMGIILTLLTPLVSEDYVTYEDLTKKLVLHRAECPVHQKFIETNKNTFRIAGMQFRMPSNGFGIACLAFIYFVGKSHGWW